MNKEDILERSRQENKGKPDEFEVMAFGKASRMGMLVGAVICMILVIVSRWVIDRPELALASWMIYMAMQGASNIVLYKHLKRQEKLISAIVCTGFAILFAVAFVYAIYLYKAGM
ncbi:MAG: hypothetical protein IKZ82_00780 [Clostridia bacterium]|nr:hypothetical protein [Clostridia bacterium]